ncbi:MAG: hypothetical protein V1696_03975 [Candidatus Jorgensenbacteria bacterium]
MQKLPREDSTYSWTYHVVEKMQYYGISEGRIRRIIRHPSRVEEGIAPQTVAVMQPAGTKRYQEMWVMYKLVGRGQRAGSQLKAHSSKLIEKPKIKVITAWRYPGKSPERDPVPRGVMEEVRRLL